MRRGIALIVLLLLLAVPLRAEEPAKRHMLATAHPAATAAGLAVLQEIGRAHV